MPAPTASASGPDGAARRFLAVVSGQARGVGPSLQRLGLSAASTPYAIAVCARNLGYDRAWIRTHRVPILPGWFCRAPGWRF